MSKYFMQDTRHAAYERMMMTPPTAEKYKNGDRRERPRRREKKRRSAQKEGTRK